MVKYRFSHQFHYLPQPSERIKQLLHKRDVYNNKKPTWDWNESKEDFQKREEKFEQTTPWKLTESEQSEILAFYDQDGKKPWSLDNAYADYNVRVERLGRPTILGYASVETVVGKTTARWNNAESTWEEGENLDKYSEYDYEFCLMSNNEIWVYFGTSKRENQKNPPKYWKKVKEDIYAIINGAK